MQTRTWIARGIRAKKLRKAARNAVAVVLQSTWGKKNKRDSMVVKKSGSFFLVSILVRWSAAHVLATEKILAKMPLICMNWENAESVKPVTKVTYITETKLPDRRLKTIFYDIS